MARIELKHCTIRFKDGFGGTAKIDDTSISALDTALEIDTLAGFPHSMTMVPVGVRFTIDTVSGTTFTVTGVNNNEQQLVTLTGASGGTFTLSWNGEGPTSAIAYDAAASAVQTALEGLSNISSGDVAVTGSAGGPWTVEFKGTYADQNVVTMTGDPGSLTGTSPSVDITVEHDGATTWELTFSPALQSGSLPSDDDNITFLPAQIDIKIGDGNLTYTENTNYDYELDRGQLDTVREADEAPMEVNFDFVYEFITTGTSESITPMDALKQKGGASAWVSASADPCEPYCIDIEVVHNPPCGSAQTETTLFPEFRPDSKEVDLGEAAVSVSGRCNAIEPIVTRG